MIAGQSETQHRSSRCDRRFQPEGCRDRVFARRFIFCATPANHTFLFALRFHNELASRICPRLGTGPFDHISDQIVLDVPEKEKVNGVPRATILLWIVPAKVHGRWQVQVEGGDPFEVTLRQKYQNIAGSANGPGRDVKLTQASLRGEHITFTVFDGAARRTFSGGVNADAMQGTVDLGGRAVRWSAKRVWSS